MALYAAWLDESGSHQLLDPSTYVVGAAICEARHADTARDQIRALLARGQRKLHWHAEDDRRRKLVADTIAGLRLVEHLVVIRSSSPEVPEKAERQRRLCLERMFPELVRLGVQTAYLESRGAKDDQRDLKTLDFLRRKRQLPGRLHIDHLRGPTEPMLWIPDACCGAVTQMRYGDPQFYAAIEARVTVIEI